MNAAEIEDQLLSPQFFENPYPLYATLRKEEPVYWSPKLSSWLITRHRDCLAMLKEPETFSSYGRVAYLLDQLPKDMQAKVEPLRAHYSVGLAHSDAPVHTRLRNILRKGVNPTIAKARSERVSTLVSELLEPLRDKTEFDFIADFAYPLPATVIAELIGAPIEDIGKFKEWADDIAALFEYGGKMSPEAAVKGVESLAEIRRYIRALVEEVRENPGDNIMSLLVNAESSEDALSEQELISTATTLFVAGHETTTNLLGLMLYHMLNEADRYATLRANPELLGPAVEEFLRYDAVIPRAWRMASSDTEIAGQKISKGQMVMAMLGSANRDPDYVDSPDRLMLERKNNRHFGFGYGIHVCMGAPLARVEASIAFEKLFELFPTTEFKITQCAWREDMAIRGLSTLWLTRQ